MANSNRGLKRSENGLPNRWAVKHGAFYYRARDEEVRLWGKRWYRLGVTREEAEKAYFEKLDEIAESQGVMGKTLADVAQIAERRVPVKGAIVYFLISEGEVVYVGKSADFGTRIFQHADKEFDSVSTIVCDENDLDATEIAYIAKLRPKYNTRNIQDGTSETYFGKPV